MDTVYGVDVPIVFGVGKRSFGITRGQSVENFINVMYQEGNVQYMNSV